MTRETTAVTFQECTRKVAVEGNEVKVGRQEELRSTRVVYHQVPLLLLRISHLTTLIA